MEDIRTEEAQVREPQQPRWYVAHTYSGYENKVKANIEKTIENRHLEDYILEVRVPLQEVVELKNGVAKTVQKKMFPGYVLVHMIMSQETWYVVRNTRGVTGFVGPGSEAVALTDTEVTNLCAQSDNIEVDFAEGDAVTVVNGVCKDKAGVIQSINQSKRTVTIMINMFGRETPMELHFSDIRKI